MIKTAICEADTRGLVFEYRRLFSKESLSVLDFTVGIKYSTSSPPKLEAKTEDLPSGG